MIIIKDTIYKDILQFLDACDKHGKNIPTVISHLPEEMGGGLMENNTVSYEARRIKAVFLKLRDW